MSSPRRFPTRFISKIRARSPKFGPSSFGKHTPGAANPIYGGASNFFVGARGSVAVTDWLSFTFDELGWDFSNVNNPQGDFHSGNGLSELHLGLKLTFIRNDVSTPWPQAAGLIFEVPLGRQFRLSEYQ